MVQLRNETVSTPKTPKMAKSKTPKKNGAAATPVMTKTPNQKVVKSPKSPAVKAVSQTPKSAKKQKAKTPKKEVVVEDVAMESDDAEEQEEEVVVKPVVKQTPKSAKKQKVKTPKKKAASPVKAEVAEEPMESDDAESDNEEASMEEEVKPQSPVKKAKGTKKDVKETEEKSAETAACVYVKNLGYAMRKDELEKHFSQFGPLQKAYLSRSRTNPRQNAGFAFVTFENEADKQKAIAASHSIMGRDIMVLPAAPQGEKRKREDDDEGPAHKKPVRDTENEIYAGRVSFSSTAEGIKKYFSKFGTVVNVALPTRPGSDLNRGFSFVKFADAAGMKAALAEANHELDSRKLVVRQAGPLQEKHEKPVKVVHEFELYVGSIAKTTTQETITDHFAKYGALKSVVLPKDHKEGGNKSFAFVAFEKKAAMDAALMEDHQVDGADLVVRDAKAKRDNKAAPKKVETKAESSDDEDDAEEAEDDDEEAEDDDEEAEDDDEEAEDDDEADDDDEEAEDDDDEEAESDDDDE